MLGTNGGVTPFIEGGYHFHATVGGIDGLTIGAVSCPKTSYDAKVDSKIHTYIGSGMMV
jgi:hypothetical protein